MSARYHVMVSDQLMASDPKWPEGLRPIEREAADPGHYRAHWWLFEDDGASESLNGKQVEVTFHEGGAEYSRRMVG
jgi:hypothetical protein